ncbi:MAG TPA: peptidoglycan-binding domain-containing protein [Gemmatimonadaceae bacterium]|nr:peptidoglycan-binding domain-containing protein [Gemmatimonadaceae bacterium]
MRLTPLNGYGRILAGAALAFVAASVASAQSRIVLPAGSVIIVRTTAPLQSASAKVGQTFETNVEESVGIDEFTVIPAGSKIRGVVTLATPATRQQSGVIEVVFDRLMLPNGSTFPITGKLTSTDSAERRQIESNPNARVVLVGERGGIGAAIAGAGTGKSANNIFAALGAMLSEGRDVSVPAGTPLAVELESAVTLRGGGRLRGLEASTIYTAAERVRAAQQSLTQLNYYRGPINGSLDDATRNALFQFQVDRGLSGTGNLDGRTARALGLNLTSGLSGAALSADQASAVRRDAQLLLTRHRTELAASSVGRLDPARAYAQGDLDLWFALSAFADNASIYEQIVRNGGNSTAAVLAGRALAGAARRVDAAMQNARASAQVQNAWAAVRQQITTIDTAAPVT